MGRLNKRALLGRLQRMGLASRADLAKSLGMSQPTAGKIVDELMALRIIEEVDSGEQAGDTSGKPAGSGAARLGRPGRMLRLNRAECPFLGIHLGVSQTSLALLAVGQIEEGEWPVKFRTPNSAEEWVRQVEKAAEKLPAGKLWGVVLSVPGIVNELTGRILFSPNLRWTAEVDLPQLLREVFEVPVELVQEERALALGQQVADAGADDFLLVDFGDGVGGAIISNGKLFAPTVPLSGELGHTPVPGNQRACGCGAVGCIETLVSRRGLLQSLAEAGEPSPHHWPGLLRRLEEGGVPYWLKPGLDAMAVIIAGALNVLGIRRVIITGTLTECPAAVTDYLSRAVISGAMWARFGQVECQAMPRRRMVGLVTVGLDRIILPMTGPDRGEPGS
jgi:predicted NBD/HSP70 family sugar kinase